MGRICDPGMGLNIRLDGKNISGEIENTELQQQIRRMILFAPSKRFCSWRMRKRKLPDRESSEDIFLKERVENLQDLSVTKTSFSSRKT